MKAPSRHIGTLFEIVEVVVVDNVRYFFHNNGNLCFALMDENSFDITTIPNV
jgi:hypothetical protein